MKNDIKLQNTGNAVAQEYITILHSVAVIQKQESVVNAAELLKRSGLAELHNITSRDRSYDVTVERVTVSEFSENMVVYIAEYVSRKLCKKLSCGDCKAGLVCNSRVV